jgi:hypothetical protein
MTKETGLILLANAIAWLLSRIYTRHSLSNINGMYTLIFMKYSLMLGAEKSLLVNMFAVEKGNQKFIFHN